MNLDRGLTNYLNADALPPLLSSPEDFLQVLLKPTWIYIKGRDSSRCRVMTTLLHGNEPSGFLALHRCLREKIVPETDLHCLIASVPAALSQPCFSTRMLPECRDLNRCFHPPFDDEQGLLAEEILAHINDLKPEAVIDIHNTSGDGPSFGVSTLANSAHVALSALFSHRLVITNIKLGALMEVADNNFHVVTVEVGGREEPSSHETAYQGLCRYMLAQSLYEAGSDTDVFEILQHPVRLEIKENKVLSYGSGADIDSDVTIVEGIEKYNFGEIPANTLLGWLGKSGLGSLEIINSDGGDLIDHFFENVSDALQTRVPMKLFMATPDPVLAMGDCLFYLVPMERCRVNEN